jgi:chitodextrinase
MRASNPNMKILVAQIIPMTPAGCTWCPSGVTALNNAIPGWAAGKTTAQSPITVVDQFTGFDTVADTNGDGVHPDDSGFQKMSDRWYPALTPLLSGQTPQPPGQPGTPVASGVTASSVALMWTASSGTVSNYQIERCQGATCTNFVQVGTSTTTTFLNNSGLLANTTYRYRVRATNSAGASPYSGIVNVTTTSSTGCVPTNLTVIGTTPSSVTITWSPPPAPCNTAGYDVFRAAGASGGTFVLVGQPTNPPFTNTGLASGSTFRYQVRARDTQGNLGPFTPAVVATTGTGGGGGCAANLTLQNGWNTGYVMQPNTVTNSGTSTINGWTVTFTLPAGHAIVGSWNATVTVNGQTVTARGIAGQNATLGAGASITWGFQGSRPNGNTAVPSTATCTSP